MGLNKVLLMGNVGSDPEIRFPEKDYPVAYLSLATNVRRGPNNTEVTEWHRLVVPGENARFFERYVRKGTRLYIEGYLRTREYTDKMQITRRITEVIVEQFELLGRST